MIVTLYDAAWQGGKGFRCVVSNTSTGEKIYETAYYADVVMGITPYSAAISLWKSITSKFGDTLQLDCSNISMLTAQEIIKGTTAKRFRAVIEQLKIGIVSYVRLSVYNDYSNKPLYSQAQQIGVVFNEEEYAKNTIRFVQHRFGNNVVYDTSKASWFRQFI